MAGSQDYAPDPRNRAVKVWLNGALVPREEAKVSIFDAGFCMGDGVWEGLRLHRGALLFLDEHLDRLEAGAAAIELDIGLDRAGLKRAMAETLAANAMSDGVHVRLMVTRGLKATPSQDPRNVIGPATIAIAAEYKQPAPPPGGGLSLACVAQRCTPAAMFDMRLNSHSRLNLIMALQQAIRRGADEALMLDPHGFVSSGNATNVFIVRDGRGADLSRRLLLQRHHARPRHRSLPRPRHPDSPRRLHSRRGARRRRSLRHRHHGRRRAGPADRRSRASRLPRPDHAADRRTLRGAEGCRGGEPGPMSEPVRIAMWSGPRNLSTAMMRAFENRADAEVVDEPFYGVYLRLTGIDHPLRDRVLAAMPTDPAAAVAALEDGPRAPSPAPRIIYEKHITTHMLPAIPLGFMAARRNAFLIRAPERVLASYAKRREQVTAGDIGFDRQAELFDREADRLGAAPPVVDAEDILAAPRAMLGALCERLGIPFDPAMLAWPAGKRASDGVWAPAWYDAVEASTSFAGPSPPPPSLPAPLQALAEQAGAVYERLASHRLRPAPRRL